MASIVAPPRESRGAAPLRMSLPARVFPPGIARGEGPSSRLDKGRAPDGGPTYLPRVFRSFSTRGSRMALPRRPRRSRASLSDRRRLFCWPRLTARFLSFCRAVRGAHGPSRMPFRLAGGQPTSPASRCSGPGGQLGKRPQQPREPAADLTRRGGQRGLQDRTGIHQQLDVDQCTPRREGITRQTEARLGQCCGPM